MRGVAGREVVHRLVAERIGVKQIGFGAEKKSRTDHSLSDLYEKVEPEDLLKYGLIPELIGRLPIVASLGELDEAALLEILTKPKNAVAKQYQKFFEMEGVKLEFTDEALRAVVRIAQKRTTGARGLRAVIEDAMLNTMYDLPSMTNASKVVVDETVVTGETEPYIIYETEEPAAVGDERR